ncbi:Polyprotein, partial [Candida maltosa Xu316]
MLKENGTLIGEDFVRFIEADDADISNYPSVFNTYLDKMIVATIAESIRTSLKHRGLHGRHMLKEISLQYGQMTTKDLTNYSIDMWTKISADNINELEKMNLMAKFFKLINKQPQNVQQALFLIIAINDPKFNKEYFEDHKDIDIKKLERFIINQSSAYNSANEKQPVSSAFAIQPQPPKQQYSNQKRAKGTDPSWGIQCGNCFGLSHMRYQCPSPMREGHIPDLEDKLMFFKRRSHFQFKRPKYSNPIHGKSVITKESQTPPEPSFDPENFSFNTDNNNDSHIESNNDIGDIMGWSTVVSNDDKQNSTSLFFDTGATAHIINNLQLLHEYQPINHEKYVITANRTKVPILGTGMIKLKTKKGIISLPNCFFCPNIHMNLLSPKSLVTNKHELKLNKDGLHHSNMGLIGKFSKADGGLIKCILPTLNVSPSESEVANLLQVSLQSNEVLHPTINAVTIENFHSAVGHPSPTTTRSMMKTFDIKCSDDGSNCIPCKLGKAVIKSPKISPLPSPPSTQPLELIFADLHGPTTMIGLRDERYFLAIEDDFTKFRFVVPIQSKRDTIQHIISFVEESEKFFLNRGNFKVKNFRSDNGGEFRNNILASYFTKKSINHQTINAHIHHENGSIERLIRTIKTIATVILNESNLPATFWPMAVSFSAFVSNRRPSKAINGKIPYEMWTKSKVNPKIFKPFGCKAYATIPIGKPSFSPQAIECILVGFASNKKSYILYDPNANKLFYSSQVRFQTNVFPASSIQFPQPLRIPPRITGITPSLLPNSTISIPPTNIEKATTYIESNVETVNHVADVHAAHLHSLTLPSQHGEEEIYTVVLSTQIQQSKKIKTNNGVGNKINELDHTDSPVLLNEANTVIPIVESNTPKSYNQAMKSDQCEKWKEAMDKEYGSILSNKTWKLVPPPNNAQIINTKWVYTIKPNNTYKARLVCLGNQQKEGVNFAEIFAPVIRSESIKLLFALAAKTGRIVHSIDISTAFLNADISEDVFISQPQGYVVKGKESMVCKLQKSLYGLRQSPLLWNKTLDRIVQSEGFTRLGGDLGIYTNENNQTYLGIYVDDIIIISKDETKINEVKEMFRRHFKITDNGRTSKFLGINVYQSSGQIKLGLADYIKNMIKDFQFTKSEVNPIATPAETSYDLFKQDDKTDYSCDATKYRSLVGKLLFAASTVRFDISYAVGVLSRFMKDPKEKHMKAAIRVVRYLNGTFDYGLCYSKVGELQVYADSDWASIPSDRKSITGYIVTYAGAPISWKSKKQPTVALSTMESEFMALTAAIKETMWLLQLFENFDVIVRLPITIYEDNTSCQKLAQNPVFHDRSKHIDLKYKFTKQHIEEGRIKIESIKSENNVADIMTKPLPKHLFKTLRSLSGMNTVG